MKKMSRPNARWLLVTILVVLWVAAVYAGYYVVHKPLTQAQLFSLADLIANLVTWLAMLIVAAALGSRLTCRLVYHSLLERLVFGAGLGLIVFSLVTLLLGTLGFLHRGVFWALLICTGLLLWREIRELGRAVRRTSWPRPKGRWQLFLVLFIAVTLLLALTVTLLPPTEWDSLVYHLVGPQRYLESHQLVTDLENYYLSFPSFSEMLFTAGMGLKGDIIPRLIHYGYLLLSLGAVAAFATRYWERRLGLTAAAIFLSIPTAVQIATWSYVDLTLTFYTFTALYAVLNWLPQDREPVGRENGAPWSSASWLVVAGLFCGAAMSIKYPGLVVLVVVGAVLLWAGLRRRISPQQLLVASVAIGGLALLVVSPWYIRNAIETGNPLYPLIWGGRNWNDISQRWLLSIGQEMSLPDLLVVPWTLTVLGTQGTVAYDATFSPLFLALLPLLLVVQRQARGLAELLLASAAGYGFWLVSGVASQGTFVLQGRFLLPIFVPLSLLCAYSLHGMRIWDRSNFSLQRFLIMVTALTLLVALLAQVLLTIRLSPWPYLAGIRDRDEYLDTYVPQHLNQARSYINENLSPEDKVLFFWEPRSYGIRVPCEADPNFDNFSQILARHGSPDGVVEGLREEGFTHVLVNQFTYPWIIEDYPITPEERAGWEEFQTRFLTDENLLHSEDGYLELYRLPRGSGP